MYIGGRIAYTLFTYNYVHDGKVKVKERETIGVRRLHKLGKVLSVQTVKDDLLFKDVKYKNPQNK